MSDWVAGLLALGIGAVFCLWGYLAMRPMISIWGGLAGFGLGASIGADDGGILANTLSWTLAIVLGLLFALIAYLYYEVSVSIAMGSIGFTLGASLLVALGVTWNWVIVLAGLALGVVLAIVAIAGDLPAIILVVLSALAGASAIVAGLMLLTGALDTDQITQSAALTEQLNDDWYWYVIWAVAAAVGLISQLRTRQQELATMREAWSGR
jgi:hypothetical protein